MPFGPDKAELAAFNPIARVPALRLADGEVLVDSAVILDHLDQVAGARALTPATGAVRLAECRTVGPEDLALGLLRK